MPTDTGTEITIEIEPAQDEVWTSARISLERYKQAIAERLPYLPAMETKDRFRLSGTPLLGDKIESEIRGLRLDCDRQYHVMISLHRGFDVGLVVAQAMHDVASVAGYDQRRLQTELELNLKNQSLGYVRYSLAETSLFEDALSRIRTNTHTKGKHWDVSAIRTVEPDIPAQLLKPAMPAKTVTVKVSQPKLETKDPIRDASIEQLEVLASDENRPDLQMRASERLTSYYASLINGRDREQPLFTRVKVNGETVLLDRFDSNLLRQQFASAQNAVVGCKKHERTIKCACLSDWHDWYYSVQNLAPTSPLALTAQNLWDLVEKYAQEYKQPKELNPELQAILQAVTRREERESEFPSWLGERSSAGWENQKARHRRK